MQVDAMAIKNEEYREKRGNKEKKIPINMQSHKIQIALAQENYHEALQIDELEYKGTDESTTNKSKVFNSPSVGKTLLLAHGSKTSLMISKDINMAMTTKRNSPNSALNDLVSHQITKDIEKEKIQQKHK